MILEVDGFCHKITKIATNIISVLSSSLEFAEAYLIFPNLQLQKFKLLLKMFIENSLHVPHGVEPNFIYSIHCCCEFRITHKL